jgi:hypothetical protein
VHVMPPPRRVIHNKRSTESEHNLPGAFRVNAHIDAPGGARRRRFIENRHLTEIGA